MVMLGECPDDMPPSELRSHNYFAYLRVDDADAYHAEPMAKGVQFRARDRRQAVGHAGIWHQAPDGHRIMIGQTIE